LTTLYFSSATRRLFAVYHPDILQKKMSGKNRFLISLTYLFSLISIPLKAKRLFR